MLQVFNEQGQLVQTVFNKVMTAGTYKADLDLGDMNTGVYYARLQNGTNQQVRNLMKVR